MRKGFLWNENFGNFCYFLMNKINIFIAFEPSTKAWKWIKMLNPKCLCKLAKTKVDLLICTNLCRVLKNKTQHKHNRARAAVQRTIFLLKFALFSKPFLKKVCASDDCNSGLDAATQLRHLHPLFNAVQVSCFERMTHAWMCVRQWFIGTIRLPWRLKNEFYRC